MQNDIPFALPLSKVHAINIEAGLGAVKTWHNEDTLMALPEWIGKCYHDQGKVSAEPVGLTSFEGGLDEDLDM
jgi:hypothetical protein